jgi:hypothetical protein
MKRRMTSWMKVVHQGEVEERLEIDIKAEATFFVATKGIFIAPHVEMKTIDHLNALKGMVQEEIRLELT